MGFLVSNSPACDVFENLVHCMTKMWRPIGIGRAIMKNIFRTSPERIIVLALILDQSNIPVFSLPRILTAKFTFFRDFFVSCYSLFPLNFHGK